VIEASAKSIFESLLGAEIHDAFVAARRVALELLGDFVKTVDCANRSAGDDSRSRGRYVSDDCVAIVGEPVCYSGIYDLV
jgi:hypothetical protein